MRAVIASLFFVAVVAQLALAQSNKSICVPIKINSTTIDPSTIPSTILTGMSDRGRGSFTVTINTCATGTVKGCSAMNAFVGFSNASGCVAEFDTSKSHPTATPDGFKVVYGSSKWPANDLQLEVHCDRNATAAYTTKTHKFATMTPNKNNGTTYMILVYSSAVCASNPAPSAKCKTVSVLGVQVDPTQWAPSFLTLDVGMTGQWSWLFSICTNMPTPPSWAPTCTPNGYAVKYSGDICMNMSFDTMERFELINNNIVVHYGSKTFPNDKAVVTIGCAQGASFLTSPTGTYTQVNNTNGGKTLTFMLGIQNMCGSVTWTQAPLPPAPSGSGSGQVPTPPPGSGSTGMPPVPSGGSGSSQMPPSPSGGSNSESSAMPSFV